MQDDSSPNLDIKRYIRIITRKRYLVISVALVVISAFTWGSFLLPKTYEANLTVSIEKSQLINPLMQGISVSAADERLRNIQNTIVSRRVLEQVIKNLGLDAAARDAAQFNGLVADIRKNVYVAVRGVGSQMQPDLFTISYRGRDPKSVVDLVNTLASEFIKESVQHQRTDAVGAYDFIEEQLVEYKKKLEDSEKAIRRFRERNPSMIPQSEVALAGRIDSMQNARIEAELKLKELLRKRESIQKQLSGEKDLNSAYASVDSSPRGRINSLNSQLMILLTKYTDDHPDVIKVRSEIEELQSQIAQATRPAAENSADNARGSEMKAHNPVYRQMKEELAKTDVEIESLKARVGELVKQQNEGIAPVGRMMKEQEEWANLQRDRNSYQRVYDELIQKRESANISRNLNAPDKTTTFRVVDPPIMPRLPVSPDRVKLILLGIVFGIAAGVGVVIGLDYIDQSYKDEDALRIGLNLPVLASVPTIITEADVAAEAMRDKKVYIAAAAYLSLIGLVFITEFLYRYLGIAIIHI